MAPRLGFLRHHWARQEWGNITWDWGQPLCVPPSVLLWLGTTGMHQIDRMDTQEKRDEDTFKEAGSRLMHPRGNGRLPEISNRLCL